MLPEEHQLIYPRVECTFCSATHWAEERLPSSSRAMPSFRCCALGKVKIPPPATPPKLLLNLLTSQDTRCRDFRRLIRLYNNAFAFTSLGAKVDPRLASARQGVYTFRIQGEIKHFVGSLLPAEGQREVFAQLHVMDASQHDRVQARLQTQTNSELSPELMLDLQQIFEQHNSCVQFFRSNVERMQEVCRVKLTILDPTTTDVHTHNIPTCDEVAALIVNDPSETATKRDIIIEHCDGSLQRIHERHPFYLPLRYPMIFPYGEQGWSEYFPLFGNRPSSTQGLRAHKRRRLDDVHGRNPFPTKIYPQPEAAQPECRKHSTSLLCCKSVSNSPPYISVEDCFKSS